MGSELSDVSLWTLSTRRMSGSSLLICSTWRSSRWTNPALKRASLRHGLRRTVPPAVALGGPRLRARGHPAPSLQALGPEGRVGLLAAVMDLSEANAEEVRFQCAQTEVVNDLLHVVVKYSRQAVDRVCVHEANRLLQD